MTASRVCRAAVAVAVVVVIAWLAIIERDTRLQSQALSAVRSHDISSAPDQLRRARQLNPDTTPELTLGLIYLGLNRPRKAAATVRRVLRAEPQNIVGWADLLLIVDNRDPLAAARARSAIRRLDPLNAGRDRG